MLFPHDYSGFLLALLHNISTLGEVLEQGWNDGVAVMRGDHVSNALVVLLGQLADRFVLQRFAKLLAGSLKSLIFNPVNARANVPLGAPPRFNFAAH